VKEVDEKAFRYFSLCMAVLAAFVASLFECPPFLSCAFHSWNKRARRSAS
jgi:hypothetical protein